MGTTDANEVATVLGDQAVGGEFGASIQALRINVTVTQGVSRYTLSVVVAPSGGARANTSPPIPERDVEEGRTDAETANREPPVSAAALALAGPGGKEELPDSIEYPFTLLSIQEMDAADQQPSPAETTSS